MVKKRKFSIKEEYKKSFRFIRQSKTFIFSIIILFCVSLLLGFFLPIPNYLLQMIKDFIQELVSKTQSMSAVQLIWYIFFNNLQVSLFGMIFGVILGIIPIILAVINGYILGFVFSVSVNQQGILSLWKIFPHGIFELPAVFISLGTGLRLGLVFFNKKEKFKELFWNSVRVFFLIVMPLLVIAGIIEGLLISFLS
jgi:stage II sporulation protein M